MSFSLKNHYIKHIIKENNLLPYLQEIEEASVETYTHSINTAGYCYVLAEALCLPKEIIKEIVIGAILHDIGKIKIPNSVLLKSTCLNKNDRYLIKMHPMYGYEMILNQFSKTVEDIVLLHHEKLNGEGYPLAIDHVPFYVQLVTVADMYDALVSKRVYKNRLSHSEAMSILWDEAEKGRINKLFIGIIDKRANLAKTG